jgi:hypothetical protein
LWSDQAQDFLSLTMKSSATQLAKVCDNLVPIDGCAYQNV